MAGYKITVSPFVEKQIGKIDSRKLREKIYNKIQQLAANPHSAPGCLKLAESSTPNTYRIRQSEYRIVFTIDKKYGVVDIIRVAQRTNVYKNI